MDVTSKPRSSKRENQREASHNYTQIIIIGIAFIAVLNICLFNYCSQQESVDSQAPKENEYIEDEVNASPTLRKSMPSQILKRTGYTLSYNEIFYQPNWVMYELQAANLHGPFKTDGNAYQPDPDLGDCGPQLIDYAKSGYVRCRLAPSGDFKWNADAMAETFYLSNVSPMNYDFRMGLWLDLENLIRQWVITNKVLWIVTGPVLSAKGFPTPMHYIGKWTHQIVVPQYFYKIVLAPGTPKAIGFILPNDGNCTGSLPNFATSVSRIEDLTGIDFDFDTILPTNVKDSVKSVYNINDWP
jgi:endonuclease G